MTDYDSQIFNKYRNKGIIVDANLLLILYVGFVKRELIGKNKKTTNYTPIDFDLLSNFVSKFTIRVTTPNILTEVSNLANSLKGDYKLSFADIFVNDFKILDEKYIKSSDVDREKFHTFGLTDLGIINLAKDKYLLLTDDFALCTYAQSQGVDTFNFNHIRPMNF